MPFRFVDLPLRRTMILAILAIVLFGGIVFGILGLRLEHQTIMSLAENRIHHDMDSARTIYSFYLDNLLTAVTLTAESELLRLPRSAQPNAELDFHLARAAEAGRFDFLSFAAADGRRIALSDPAVPAGGFRDRDSFFSRVLEGKRLAATRLLPLDSLRRESTRFGESAAGDILVLVAAAPVRGPEGRIIGVLEGGRRINGDNEIVDRVKAAIFDPEKRGGRDTGVVTIHQGDIRASTTLKNPQGSRLNGTRADPRFRQEALERRKAWAGRAVILGERYISASEPLADYDGTVVGMLSIGLLERPFLALRNRVITQNAAWAAATAAVLLILLSLMATRLVRPLGDLAAAASRIAQGDLNLKVPVGGRDEIGELGGAFNRMTAELRKAKENLLQWTWTLESRVADRTHALRNIQESMARSEKMASLGQLAAGIAHEINNPLTTILINAHLLLEKARPDDPAAAALRLLAEDTERCGRIVKGLLEYSRRTPPEKSALDVNALVERTIGLLSGQAWARNIRLSHHLDRTLPPLLLDGAKIQQVFWTLILNACEAMPSGGTIDVSSRRSADGRSIEVVFTDSGPGIPEESLGRIFDPFFTTKSSGTGLGLAVAARLVEQHGGTISARNGAGRGAVFTIQWPLTDTETGDRGIGP